MAQGHHFFSRYLPSDESDLIGWNEVEAFGRSELLSREAEDWRGQVSILGRRLSPLSSTSGSNTGDSV